MVRANRHHIPGQIWHITHRCHQKAFLLQFARDRKRWIQWLFEAKKRYGLDVPVGGGREADVIPKRLQRVVGKTAQAFNRKKARKGAFWEDRYHATAIETGEHFLRCLVYIDLNRVRNGVVHHPCAWRDGGYHERQNPPLRYTLMNREPLIACCGLDTNEQLPENHRQWVEEAIHHGSHIRQPRRTESLAVGSEEFVQGVLPAETGATGEGASGEGRC